MSGMHSMAHFPKCNNELSAESGVVQDMQSVLIVVEFCDIDYER